MEILKSTEEVADQVLVNKQELINLDRRRQQNREAIRELEKNPEQQEKKVWTTIGSMLVKLKREKALELLKNGINVMLLLKVYKKNFNFSAYFQIKLKLNVK